MVQHFRSATETRAAAAHSTSLWAPLSSSAMMAVHRVCRKVSRRRWGAASRMVPRRLRPSCGRHQSRPDYHAVRSRCQANDAAALLSWPPNRLQALLSCSATHAAAATDNARRPQGLQQLLEPRLCRRRRRGALHEARQREKRHCAGVRAQLLRLQTPWRTGMTLT